MQRLCELPLAAVVVEKRVLALFKPEHVEGAWLADQLVRLHVRYSDVHLVYAELRERLSALERESAAAVVLEFDQPPCHDQPRDVLLAMERAKHAREVVERSD